MNRRYLALGDSYTIGEGVPAAASWPNRLVDALRDAGCRIDAPQVLARTGWTSDELAGAMDGATFTPPYALVTLLIGVNDQYRGRDMASFRKGFQKLVSRSIALTANNPSHVLVVSIPDWGVSRFAREHGHAAESTATTIDAFNAVAREEATQAGVRWVDVTTISRHCGDAADMLAADGLHPSAAQYALWIPRILGAARAILPT